MRELIDPSAAERFLLFAALGGPLAGFIIGIMLGAHENRAIRKMVAGTLIGGLCTVAYAMWRVYNAITERLGLDSVVNTALQLVMFAALGLLIGFAAHAVARALKRIGAAE